MIIYPLKNQELWREDLSEIVYLEKILLRSAVIVHGCDNFIVVSILWCFYALES